MDLSALLSVAVGLGLAAACGFRVFVPLLVLSAAANAGWLELSPRFDWLGAAPALIALACATVVEIGAYYIPWVDNLLDTLSTPAAVVAGVVATASVATGMEPFLKWSLALIAGGGLAGGFQLLTSGARGASSLTTGGLANTLLATVEAGGSLVLSLLAIFLPLVALVVVVGLMWLVWRLARRRRVRALA